MRIVSLALLCLLTTKVSAELLTEVKHSYTYRTTVTSVPLVATSITESAQLLFEPGEDGGNYGYFNDFVIGANPSSVWTATVTAPSSVEISGTNPSFAGWAANLKDPNGVVSLFSNFGTMPGNDVTLAATALLVSGTSSTTNPIEPNAGWTTWFTDSSSEVVPHVGSYSGYTLDKVVLSIDAMSKTMLDAGHAELSLSQSMQIYGHTNNIPEPASLSLLVMAVGYGLLRRSRA